MALLKVMNPKLSHFILPLTILLVLYGCKQDPFLTVTPANLSFTEEGGSQTVQVSSNYAWTTTVSGTGISVSPSSGQGESVVTVKVDHASSPDPVSGSIVFSSEGLSAIVTVLQDAKSVIQANNVVSVPVEGGSIEVPIQYNTDFTVEVEPSAQSWIEFVQTRALTSGRLVFYFEENASTDVRSGVVTIKDRSGKVAPVTVTFVQEERKVIEVGDVTTIPAAGGTYEVDIRYNTDFTVEVEPSAQSWIKFVQTRALTSGRLVFYFGENASPDSRTGVVTVKDEHGQVDPVTLTFVQEAPYLRIVCPDAESLLCEGGMLTVSIEHNTPYQAHRILLYNLGDDRLFSNLDYVFEDESAFLTQLRLSYGRNHTRHVRAGYIVCQHDSRTVSDTLSVCQPPVAIVTSEKEIVVPVVASVFSFRVAGIIPEDYRVECSSDWLELIGSEVKGGEVEYRWRTKDNESGTREDQIKVYLNGYDEPDVVHVQQEGREMSFSVTYSARQVTAPFVFGPFLESCTIWWGDGNSALYTGGLPYAYGTSGSHTLTITTKQMPFIERAEVRDIEEGMHIDFSGMRGNNE